MKVKKNLLKKKSKSFYFASIFLSRDCFTNCSQLYNFCRIVDDIADTGQTLNSFSKLDDVYIATIHYHEQSQFVPDKWVLQKKDKWIVYPWEKEYWEKQ